MRLKHHPDNGCPHVYDDYPKHIAFEDNLPPIDFPTLQPLDEFRILRQDCFGNGVKLGEDKNPDRVVFRQVTGQAKDLSSWSTTMLGSSNPLHPYALFKNTIVGITTVMIPLQSMHMLCDDCFGTFL